MKQTNRKKRGGKTHSTAGCNNGKRWNENIHFCRASQNNYSSVAFIVYYSAHKTRKERLACYALWSRFFKFVIVWQDDLDLIGFDLFFFSVELNEACERLSFLVCKRGISLDSLRQVKCFCWSFDWHRSSADNVYDDGPSCSLAHRWATTGPRSMLFVLFFFYFCSMQNSKHLSIFVVFFFAPFCYLYF